MRIVVQRCSEASVSVDNKEISSIGNGLMILVGFTESDEEKQIDYLVNKTVNLRIFDDENGVMNKSVIDVGGEILCISQFTLYADTSHGNRPSYIKAMASKDAINLYDKYVEKLNQYVTTKKGVFGADMAVNLVNNGPVTIIIDSKVK